MEIQLQVIQPQAFEEILGLYSKYIF